MAIGNLLSFEEAGCLGLGRMVVIVAPGQKQPAVVPRDVEFFTSLVNDAKDGLETVPQPELTS